MLFDKDTCQIKNQHTGHLLANIQKIRNNMFPLEISCMEQLGLMVNGYKYSTLWHLRYGHLHTQGLRTLSQKSLVEGLLPITVIDF